MDHLLPLPIAQVHTPQGTIWYIAQAQHYQGFVVQRRYRGAGAAYYTHDYPRNNQGRIWRDYRHVEPRLVPSSQQKARFHSGNGLFYCDL